MRTTRFLVLVLALGCTAAQGSKMQPVDDTQPPVELLAATPDWSESTTDSLAAPIPSLVVDDDPDGDLALAQAAVDSAGGAAWVFNGEVDHPEGPDTGCSGAGWIGCSFTWSVDPWTYAFTCWVNTAIGSAYCNGFGDYDMGLSRTTGHRLRWITSIYLTCGRGPVRGC
jgi:hypothetical protein